MNAIKKAYDALIEGDPARAEDILGKALDETQATTISDWVTSVSKATKGAA